MQQLKHDKTKKPEDPVAAKARLEKKAKGFRWQTGVSIGGSVAVAVALMFAGRDCCGKKVEPICEPPQTIVKLPTAEELRSDTTKCHKNALIQVRDTIRSSGGCDSIIVVDTARYSSSSDPNDSNYCPACKPSYVPPVTPWCEKDANAHKNPDGKCDCNDGFEKVRDKTGTHCKERKKDEPKCGPCAASIAGSEEVAVTLKARARTKTMGKVSDLKEALGVPRNQELTVTYLVEVDELGTMTLKGAKASSGGNALDGSRVAEITGFTVSGTTGRPGVTCCTVPISVVLPAEY